MNKMYEYLEEHAYISKNKKSNYQFELTRERAECIANKYNSLCEEKDKEIERLTLSYEDALEDLDKKENIIKEVREYIESYNLEYLHEANEHNLADILEELLEILYKESK